MAELGHALRFSLQPSHMPKPTRPRVDDADRSRFGAALRAAQAFRDLLDGDALRHLCSIKVAAMPAGLAERGDAEGFRREVGELVAFSGGPPG